MRTVQSPCERLTKEVRELINVLDTHGPVPKLAVYLLTQLAHRLGVLQEVIDSKSEHAYEGKLVM